MSGLRISIVGAHHGPEVVVSGEGAGEQGIALGEDQVKGIYDAPTETEWSRARRQRGGSLRGIENPERLMTLGFHTSGERGEEWGEVDDLLRSLFSYGLDEWYPEDDLAQLVIESESDLRSLRVQMSKEPEFSPKIDPAKQKYGNVFYQLTAGQPMWESPETVTAWETAGTSGTGTITVSNPTDQVMFPTWVLTPGTWTVPDVAWVGPPRRRTVADARTIPLKPVTSGMGGLSIRCDPMRVTFVDQAGTNVMGQVAGDYYLVNFEIPPYTPATELPISVTAAPSGGARAELHQPRLWSRPWGLQ